MRVLFTSLFFVLVAFLTLASHPPVEAISKAFGGTSPSQEPPELADTGSTPTGIIPVPDTAGAPMDLTPDPEKMPDPISVPDAGNMEETVTGDLETVETVVLVEEILVAPEAIRPPDATPPTESVEPGETTAPKEMATEIDPPAPTEEIAATPEAIEPPEEPSPAASSTSPALTENPDTPEIRGYVRSLNLYAVFYNAGETDLPQGSRADIDKAAKQLANIPDGLNVIVGGYADTHSEDSDPQIADLRAEKIRDALVAAGAPADRLQVARYRATKNRSASDAWRDRRVEFHVLPPR